MFLSVDVGNTQTAFGLIDKDGLVVHHWRTKTDKLDTADELAVRLMGLLASQGFSVDAADEVAVASVVPALQRAWRVCLMRLGKDPLMVGLEGPCPIEVALAYPSQVGADRIANAVEAKERYGAPAIVVDFGTATNIDVVAPNGSFVGGVIAPGVMLGAQALFDRASKLSSTPIAMPAHVVGRDSEQALQSGIVIGAAAMAEGLVSRIQAELAVDGCPVVATGGLARTVSAATDCFTAVDPDLTLRGIYRIWRAQA
ncbi:type III pantothenate kinase [Atopobiaceae bacterium 24-176]